MNNYNFQGIIEEIFPVEEFSNFKKQGFLVVAEEKKGDDKTFTHKHYFECLGDKVTLLQNKAEGQKVDVFFNIKTNELEKDNTNKKIFTSLTAWKIIITPQQ